MTASNTPAPNRRIRRSLRNAAVGAVAVLSVGAIWTTAGVPAGADKPSSSVEQTDRIHSPEFDAALARFAMSRNLSGLSAASLAASQQAGCRGLSIASATGCTASELTGR